jgi:hypothetical protein
MRQFLGTSRFNLCSLSHLSVTGFDLLLVPMLLNAILSKTNVMLIGM